MLVLEHVDNLPVEDFLFQARLEDQAIRIDHSNWKNIVIPGLTQGQYNYDKTEIMSRGYVMTEANILEIFRSIPETIKCLELINFLSDLLPIFIRLHPENIRKLLPDWIVNKVSLFESLDRE